MIYLDLFGKACAGNHQSSGQWKEAPNSEEYLLPHIHSLSNNDQGPQDTTSIKDRLHYWLSHAQHAERGRMTTILFTDGYITHNIYSHSEDFILRVGTQAAALDPMVLIPAIASVMNSVGFGVPGSTSYLGIRLFWRGG